MDLDCLVEIVRDRCRLVRSRIIVVGVSGGPDSLCLLDGLNRLGFPLLAAHFDHGLRPESAEDARLVESMMREMGVQFVVGKEDVRSLAEEWRISIEEAARKARYRFLFDRAREVNAQAVAVAHTADDQVETVLMHLLRGTGLNGLRGMAFRTVLPEWDATLPLVRPLLGMWRTETEAWCVKHGIYPIDDASNRDTTFFRNRLRHELIPILKSYNPNIKEVIFRMAQVLGGDAEVIAEAVESACIKCQMEREGEEVRMNLDRFQDLAPGLQRAVLRQAIGSLRPGLRDVDFGAVERGLQWLADPPEGRAIDLTAGLHCWAVWGRIYISEKAEPSIGPDWPQVERGFELLLELGGKVELLNGWALTAELVEMTGRDATTAYYLAGEGLGRLELEAWLDAESVQWPLVVRSAYPGERFAPLGMDGHHMKLSDFFTNEKVPLRARAGWPLVINKGKVAWVMGFRISENVKTSLHTQKCVRIELKSTPFLKSTN